MLDALSKRERQILDMVRRGWTQLAIASQLGIAEQTVKNHCLNARRKLGIKDRHKMLREFLAEEQQQNPQG